MNVTLKNLGDCALPVTFAGRTILLGDNIAPWVKELSASCDEPLKIDDPQAWVVSIGENPSFVEEFKSGLAEFLDVFHKLVHAWHTRSRPDKPGSTHALMVGVELTNHGPNPLRVLLGSNLNEVHVAVGDCIPLSSVQYIEMRELGV
jgi:hypothetical protein